MGASLKAQSALRKARGCLRQASALLQLREFDGAVNRAYYAMFHAAEALLLSRHGLEFARHGHLLGAFGKHFVATGLVPKHMHQLLHWAFHTREKADYDLAVEVSVEEATESCAAAEEFVAFVRPLVEGEGGDSP